jgi:hypothetical protein
MALFFIEFCTTGFQFRARYQRACRDADRNHCDTIVVTGDCRLIGRISPMELAGWFRQPAFDLQQQFLAPARESAQHSSATSIQGLGRKSIYGRTRHIHDLTIRPLGRDVPGTGKRNA